MSTTNKQIKQNITFDSDDTESSDLSYESSDEENNHPHNSRKIQLFKEEMTRFFIHRPDLRNNQFFEPEDEPIEESELPQAVQLPQCGSWQNIAAETLKQTRRNHQVPSIQNFAKRLQLYRNKVEKVEVIDTILRQQQHLLREIDQEIAKQKKAENAIHDLIQAKLKKETGDVTYYSWRKNKQLEFRIDKAEERARHSNKIVTDQNSEIKLNNTSFTMPNIEPKTATAKELVEQLKKCPDIFTAKRTVINFLVKHQQKTKAEFGSKPTLLQQGQKFSSEEAKEFVLLYPNIQIRRKLEGQFDAIKAQSLNCENSALVKSMNAIAKGNLMSYWKSMQDKKV